MQSNMMWVDPPEGWKHGFPAVMITDTSFLRNPNYHKATDTPDTLNYNKMAEVVDGVSRFIDNL